MHAFDTTNISLICKIILSKTSPVALPFLPQIYFCWINFCWLYLLLFMSNSVYQINKGINKPIEFKGLKAQYIWYLGGGLAILLIFFAVIYIIGVNVFICLAVIISLATALFMYVYKLSRRYGEFGLMKKMANKAVPKVIKSYSIIRLRKQLLHEKSV
jgi:Domain of unknown function (DUF4133)